MNIEIVDLAREEKDKQREYVKQIALWSYTEWGKYIPDKPLAEWEMSAQELKPDQYPITLIALDFDERPPKLAGVVRLKYDDGEGMFPDGQKGYRLSGLHVDPSYRKQGIALELTSQILQIADDREIKQLSLFSHSKDAVDYYQKHGWTHERDQRIQNATASVFFANVKELLQALAIKQEKYTDEKKIYS